MSIYEQILARRAFQLAQFELVPLEFGEAGDSDELLLDEPVEQAAPPVLRVVPTAGELHESIERHLRGDGEDKRRADAADELRNALAELRRSLA